MKDKLKLLAVIILSLLYVQTTIAQEEKTWFEDGPWSFPKENPDAKKLPLILVKGNSFVKSNGDTILFRGVAISDPDKIEHQGMWGKKHFEHVKEMGASIVRIPIHPIAWRERTPDGYLKLLDEAVHWCTELGMYVMLDWHSIGNLGMELFQNPMYNTTKKETYEFWRTMAFHFKGHNTVAFYELFNEPTLYRGTLGTMSWAEWKSINEKIISLIRAFDADPIPLVAGLDWAYDLNPIRTDPINADNIGYTSHPYEHKRKPPWEPKWEEAFGFAKEKYPVVVTEFGFGIRPGEEIADDHYCYKIVDYLENKQISWVCWVYDPQWGPRLLKSWDTYELTKSGEFFKNAMQKNLNSR